MIERPLVEGEGFIVKITECNVRISLREE